MRKVFFIALLISVLQPHRLLAQTGLHGGVVSGFNSTWVIAQEQYEQNRYRYKKAFAFAPFGVSLGYKFNERHGIQVEAFRSNIEGKYELLAENGVVGGEKVIDLKYWSIPLLFKFTSTGDVRFSFAIGPQISFLSEGEEYNTINQTIKFHRPGRSDTTFTPGTYLLASTEQTVPREVATFNNVDVGIASGIGVEYNFTDNLYLSANLRLNYNFRNVFNEESIAYPHDIDTYTLRYNALGGIQLGLHYFFFDQDVRRSKKDPFENY
ncbi:MAG: PorT family protein [Hymenobacteraceae bacterium]|nr:PorT family protein [Hymenobacteraceae bacterium]MDX5395876.1 PorT family protein [Hymenobacteraceae bacterium]MDX5444302.1 PorT family protein [Hymenobacteraceae bacterium]MDX5511931.1 PorT family protein [Hymenobacteraceae bacterium]